MALQSCEIDDRAWRFEVCARDRSGQLHVVGWTDDPGGGALVKLAWRDPATCEVIIAAAPDALSRAAAPA